MLARRTKCLRGPRSVWNASGLSALCHRLHCCPRLVKREQAPRTPNAGAQSVSPGAKRISTLLRFRRSFQASHFKNTFIPGPFPSEFSLYEVKPLIPTKSMKTIVSALHPLALARSTLHGLPGLLLASGKGGSSTSWPSGLRVAGDSISITSPGTKTTTLVAWIQIK